MATKGNRHRHHAGIQGWHGYLIKGCVHISAQRVPYTGPAPCLGTKCKHCLNFLYSGGVSDRLFMNGIDDAWGARRVGGGFTWVIFLFFFCKNATPFSGTSPLAYNWEVPPKTYTLQNYEQWNDYKTIISNFQEKLVKRKAMIIIIKDRFLISRKKSIWGRNFKFSVLFILLWVFSFSFVFNIPRSVFVFGVCEIL